MEPAPKRVHAKSIIARCPNPFKFHLFGPIFVGSTAPAVGPIVVGSMAPAIDDALPELSIASLQAHHASNKDALSFWGGLSDSLPANHVVVTDTARQLPHTIMTDGRCDMHQGCLTVTIAAKPLDLLGDMYGPIGNWGPRIQTEFHIKRTFGRRFMICVPASV